MACGHSTPTAISALTAAYHLALHEMDGVPDIGFVRGSATIAQANAVHPREAVEKLAAYIPEVEAVIIPGAVTPASTGWVVASRVWRRPVVGGADGLEASSVPLITFHACQNTSRPIWQNTCGDSEKHFTDTARVHG